MILHNKKATQSKSRNTGCLGKDTVQGHFYTHFQFDLSNIFWYALNPDGGNLEIGIPADEEIKSIEVTVNSVLYGQSSDPFFDESLPLEEGRYYIYVRGYTHSAGGLKTQTWTSPVYLGPAA